MASHAKRLKFDDEERERDYTSESGFIHNVSPMKTSQARGIQYFNAELQQADKFVSVVGYSATARNQLKAMEQNKSPVKLSRVQKVSSLRTPGEYDIKLNNKSTITEPTQTLAFSHQSKTSSTTTAMTKIEMIKTMDENTRVSVNATVIKKNDESEVNVRGTPLKMVTCLLGDETGTIQCSLWEKHISLVQEQRAYLFQNVTIKHYETKKLSTNPTTVISEIDQMENVKEEEESLPKFEHIEVCAARVHSHTCCNACNNELTVNHQLPTIKCSRCDKRQLTSSLKKFTKCEINATTSSGSTETFSLNENVLKEFLPDITDNDEIEIHLLTHSRLMVSTMNPSSKVITKMKYENDS